MPVPWMPCSSSWTKIAAIPSSSRLSEELREVVVGVDAGGEHDVEAALVGHALAEGGVAVEEHRARLDDGRDAMALDRVGVGDGGVPLGLLVVEVRELEAPSLVGGPEVLVDERQAKLVHVHGPTRGLDCRHGGKLSPAGLGPRGSRSGIEHRTRARRRRR